MTVELIKRMMDACYQAKRVRDLLPPLPKGVMPSYIHYLDSIQKLEQQAKNLDLASQRDIMRAGGTDAGVMHTTRIGVRTGGVSVPCRYIHTPVEMADLKDAQDCVKLLTAFVQSKLESL